MIQYQTRYSNSKNMDAFDRLRTSNPYTLLEAKQIYDNLPLIYDDKQTSGSGASSTYNTFQASSTISVSANTAGSRVRQTKLRGVYQVGKSLLIDSTFILGNTSTGITKRVGYYDNNNGIFLQSKNGNISITFRSDNTGSIVDTEIPRSEWDDPMDGSNMSDTKHTLDFSKVQNMQIDMSLLGGGRVRVGFVIEGELHYVKTIFSANDIDNFYVTTPNLPLRHEIVNDGTGGASSLTHISACVISEGGQENQYGYTSYISRDGSAITLGNTDTYTPIISYRLKSDRLGARVIPLKISTLLTSTTNFEWRLYFNPTIDGIDAVNWQNVSNSSLQYDISRTNLNSVSGGIIIAGGYGASTNQVTVEANGVLDTFLALGSNIDGTRDELVLAIANIDGSGGTAYGGIMFKEIV